MDEQEIRNKAYEIWERNGRPNGKDEEFWEQSKKELSNKWDYPIDDLVAMAQSHNLDCMIKGSNLDLLKFW